MELFLPLLFLCYSKCVVASPSEFISLKFPKIFEEGNLCSVTPTENGTCVLSPKCELSVHQKTINICGWEGLTPKVCCSHNRQIEATNTPKRETKLTVSADEYNKRFQGPECMVKSGPDAECSYFFDCNDYPEGETLYICGWHNFTPKICCDNENLHTSYIRSPPKFKSYREEGSACDVTPTKGGTCELVINCKSYPTAGVITICGWELDMPIICCLEPELGKFENFNVSETVDEFKPYKLSECGIPRESYYREFITINGRFGEFGIYTLNRTADILRSRGYTLQVTRMDLDDIQKMHATKGNRKYVYSMKISKSYPFVAGGKNATEELSQYMASLGIKSDDSILWLCDGVVINFQWIMSAAHCFVFNDVQPNIIRLGVYKKGELMYKDTHDYYSIEDFGISKVVFYPEFVDTQRYHDIVLIRLSRPIPQKNRHINPICLPWGLNSGRRFVNEELTLTGWGATKYLGDKTNVLQEVKLTVFPTEVCNKSYSTLRDYTTKWPEGMDINRVMCAGSIEGGKDACKGDSGGPLVFLDKSGRLTLAGIVSTGYGCGLKEFPGLYTRITIPKYLAWIKQVAF